MCWGIVLLRLSPVVGGFIMNCEFLKDRCSRKMISNESFFNNMVLSYFKIFKLIIESSIMTNELRFSRVVVQYLYSNEYDMSS